MHHFSGSQPLQLSTPPPQSMSVSVPFLILSLHDELAHVPPVQLPLEQSGFVKLVFPDAQGNEAEPPQSRSVSEALMVPSMHVTGTHLLEAHSKPVKHIWEDVHSTHAHAPCVSAQIPAFPVGKVQGSAGAWPGAMNPLQKSAEQALPSSGTSVLSVTAVSTPIWHTYFAQSPTAFGLRSRVGSFSTLVLSHLPLLHCQFTHGFCCTCAVQSASDRQSRIGGLPPVPLLDELAFPPLPSTWRSGAHAPAEATNPKKNHIQRMSAASSPSAAASRAWPAAIEA
jgi:hypothetical protein